MPSKVNNTAKRRAASRRNGAQGGRKAAGDAPRLVNITIKVSAALKAAYAAADKPTQAQARAAAVAALETVLKREEG